MKKIKVGYFIPLVLITVFTFLVWQRSLGQALIGEGSAYFSEPYISMIDKAGISSIVYRYDVQAFLITKYIFEYFRDTMWLYYFFMLVVVSFVGYLLYLIVTKVSESKLAGFLVVLLFIGNYMGSFQKLGQGYYQWFLQRIPNFIPGILSLLLLVYFFSTKNKKYYFLSLGFYLLAFFLAHYTLIILPIYVIYPLMYVFINHTRNIKEYGLAILSGIPFILGTYFLLRDQDLNSSQISFSNQINSDVGVVYFISNRPTLILDLLREISSTMIPTDFMKFVSGTFDRFFAIAPSLSLGISGITYFVSIVFNLFLLVILLISFKKIPKSGRPFLLAIAISIPLVAFTVMYINQGAIGQAGSSRYLYTLSMVVAMFLSIALTGISRIGRPVAFMIILMVLGWYFYNQKLINHNFNLWQPRHEIVLGSFRYLKDNQISLPNNAIILIPAENGGYGSGMMDHFYGNRIGTKFMSLGTPLHSRLLKEDKEEKPIYMIYADPKSNFKMDKVELEVLKEATKSGKPK